MVESTKDPGRTTKCMVEESLSGLMVVNIRASMSMIKKKDMENSVGLMEDVIADSGKMENKMEKVLTEIKRELKRMVFGSMGKKLSGLIDKLDLIFFAII